MSERRRYGGPNRRPPWWPAGEAWPPPYGAWWYMRRRFLRRVGLLLGVLLALVLGASVLGAIAAGHWGGADHGGGGWQGPPVFGIVLFLGGAFLVLRLLRRSTAPMGDLMEATGRLAGGDFSARVRPQGPPETRELADAFNALAERLQKTESERRDLIADVTHELRTPLAVIRGTAEGIADGLYKGDAAQVGLIIEQAQAMARLIDDLGTLSTAEAGRLSLHREETEPADLVEDAVESFRTEYERTGVKLRSEAASGLPAISVDPLRVKQVLANLLSNALRHTPAGGSVAVSASAEAGGVQFRVRDSGTGIPPDQLPFIFERFRKSEDSAGSGLGLAIARALVEAHGGRIEAESEPGKGTVVTFNLPAAP